MNESSCIVDAIYEAAVIPGNWPKVIEMDAATRAKVDGMWKQLGIAPIR